MRFIRFHHHRCRSEETKKRFSESRMGKPNWKRGLTSAEDSRILSGKDHGMWKGGIKPLNRIIRDHQKSNDWRESIFERDNYTCRKCSKEGNGNLNAHHIYQFNEIIKNNNIQTIEDALNCQQFWDINNGITYCKECHIEEHKQKVV